MSYINSFIFPDIPSSLSEILLKEDRTRIIVGVIGKSSFADCNKIAGLGLLRQYTSLLQNDNEEGRITFYFEKDSNSLFLHFETAYDAKIMLKLMEEWTANHEDDNHQHLLSFNSYVRTRFAKMLLFAIHVCHIIILVETAQSFDVSYLSLFKSLKLIREKYVLKFLPKFLRNSNVGSFMGKEGRLCSPRFLFYFEKCFHSLDKNTDSINKVEFELEDDIYKMLRNEFIITNNSSASLFSIPRNKRFVYINTDEDIRIDPLLDAMNNFSELVEKSTRKGFGDTDNSTKENFIESFKPYAGFAQPWNLNTTNEDDFVLAGGGGEGGGKSERSILSLIKNHVNEALQAGFDDSMSKFRGKSHFVKPNTKTWYDSFNWLYKLFIENPNNPNFEANDSDYRAYLENFDKLVDIDEKFFLECSEHGLELALATYNELVPHHYNSTVHNQNLQEAVYVLRKFARGPWLQEYEKQLRLTCETSWKSGKQQCEFLSLRGNPCILPKHESADLSDHSSGVVFVSSCNCGKTKGHRDDPYTIKDANYNFYQLMNKNCTTCNKLEKITFPVFQPSVNDFRPAPMSSDKLAKQSNQDNWMSGTLQTDYAISQASPQINSNPNTLSYSYLDCLDNMDKNRNTDKDNQKKNNENFDGGDDNPDEDSSINEIVIKVGDIELDAEKVIVRQASTTEYLAGMVHSLTPVGLLPLFPSWSLVCIGPSSVYSHNTGLPEHVQSGFLTGANYLLPWDVQVRLEHAAEWAASYEKTRNRKKLSSKTPNNNVLSNPNAVFSLKIFVGNEYECPRGHRFIMSGPDKVLRGGGSSGLVRESGSKVVFNHMPLYHPCPCRSSNSIIAQLMRIHVVTPKAPVNIILDPKIRTGNKNTFTFITGLAKPAKLTQSAYWILRLPYVYQGDGEPIAPPMNVSASNTLMYGCLLAGMYGISEIETEKE